MYNLDIPGWATEADLKVLEYFSSEVSKDGLILEVGSFCGRTSYALAKSCDPSTRVVCIDLWREGTLSISSEKNYNKISPKLDIEFKDLNGDISKNPDSKWHTEKEIFSFKDMGPDYWDPMEEHKKWTQDCINIERIKGQSPNTHIKFNDYFYETTGIKREEYEINWYFRGETQKIDLLFIDDEHSFDIAHQVQYWSDFMSPNGKICGHDFYYDSIDPKRVIKDTWLPDEDSIPGKTFVDPEYFWGIRQSSRILKRPLRFGGASSIWWIDLADKRGNMKEEPYLVL
jgi:hypothetical protein|tara:strand:+ start:40 stop:897 length:858 start_codon:yes stop_codon:yes gene_type:complete